MSSQHIRVLKANVSRSEAERAFAPAGVSRALGIQKLRPLRSVAELYVPFRAYKVSIRRGKTLDRRWMAIDLISGQLDPFSFESLPSVSEMEIVTSRNRPEVTVDDAAARTILTTKIHRVLFQSGFFRMKNLEIQFEPASVEFHMPYWIGFFGAGETASIKILDATRRVMEGGKFRSFIYEWLAA
jgi:hypothetical protein